MLGTTHEVSSTELGIVLVPIGVEEGDPLEAFDSYTGRAYRITSERLADHTSVHHIFHQNRRSDNNRTLEGRFLCMEVENLWFVVMTHQDVIQGQNLSMFRDLCLLPWIERFYPRLVRSRIRARTLLSHLQTLHESVAEELIVVRSDIRLSNGHMHIEQPESIGTLSDRLVREHGHLAGATYHQKGSRGYEATSRKDGLLYFHRGDFHTCFHDWLELLGCEKAFAETMNQATACYNPYELNAIDIDFGDGAGTAIAQIGRRLAASLDRRPNLTVSVLHGNPYLHVSVFDTADGSTFTLFSRGGGVRVLPGRNANRSALGNLMNAISEGFQEIDDISLTALRTDPSIDE